MNIIIGNANYKFRVDTDIYILHSLTISISEKEEKKFNV